MNVLGIETSCDETAAAVVKNGRCVLSNIIVSSLKDHKKYGGIIPEIASRRQLECIAPVVDQALADAGLGLNRIDAIAVTEKPGLIGSLLVGQAFAQSLSFTSHIPLIKVDHIQAHLYANVLRNGTAPNGPARPALPAVGLVVSGGHTSLYYIKNFTSFKLLGSTRDDAAGEAFDKTATILKLGYPGGPIIDRLAQKGKKSHIQFTCAQLPDTLDFSFSGIKTAVLYYTQRHQINNSNDIPNICFAFQKSVVSVLVDKSIAAAEQYKTKTLLIGGGVAANSMLRDCLKTKAKEKGISTYFPPLPFCLDNAAMIAGLGYHNRNNGISIN